ncbi:MAG: hypothetical protein KatS3mg095_0857 [Candidatus Parcubacteria bacterium]|nr:MAG: hypothetical protein KatS3mg095_0857 [Candidatus Parcubacteria bacterium]
MEKEVLQKIIEAGNLAPSGGNSQPWEFIADSQNFILEVIMHPEKDHEILNYRNRGTYIAHGALLENIEIASKHFGYKIEYKIFPDNHKSFLIKFEPSEKRTDDDLYEEIFKRCSNRKPFSTEPIKEEEKQYLLAELNKYPQCEVILAEDRNKIQALAQNLTKDSLANFSNKKMHKLMFKEILFDEKEQYYKGGLYVRTLEIPPQAVKIFKLFKYWPILSVFKKLGFINKINQGSIRTASSCALIGGMFIKNNDEDFIYAGKLLENIWIRATKLNLGFHLITGVPFLWQRINYDNDIIFSNKEKEIIKVSYQNIIDIFDLKGKDKLLAFVFRIGKSLPPSAVSYKRPAIINWV